MSRPNIPSPSRVNALTAGAVLLAIALTIAASAIGGLRFTYHAPALHVAIETTATMTAALVALLTLGSARRSGMLVDALLCASLAFMAASTAAFSLVPLLADSPPGRFAMWSAVGARLILAAGLLAAALAPPRRIADPHGLLRRLLLAATLLLAAVAGIVFALGDRLPAGVNVQLLSPSAPNLVGPPLLLAQHLVVAAASAAAAIGFVRRRERGDADLHGWLAGALALTSVANVNYFLFPSRYSEYVHIGDVVRLGSLLMLLCWAFSEIERRNRELLAAAGARERRRLAGDIHDGLAQELAFIVAESRRLAAEGATSLAAIERAGDRALAEARTAISVLSQVADPPLATAIARVATEASRGELYVEVDAPEAIEPRVDVREALLRIAGDAAANAVRHGAAERLRIELRNGNGVTARLIDDGAGFDASSTPGPGHFGVVGMRRRAEDLGGRLDVVSRTGAGTTIEVHLP